MIRLTQIVQLGLCACMLSYGSIARAEDISLSDYLDSIDSAEVMLSGLIQYDNARDEFNFIDDELGRFSIRIDAGREARERIEEECLKGGLFSRANFCEVIGSGSVEIRGSSVSLSLERLDELVSNGTLEVTESVADASENALSPPLTGSERNYFIIAVTRCWNIVSGTGAERTTVEVGFSLDPDGTVKNNEVQLLSTNGDQSATVTAFEAARRAILRCQGSGYDLPSWKYDQWKDVVMTFDPAGIRLR